MEDRQTERPTDHAAVTVGTYMYTVLQCGAKNDQD